MAPTKGVSSSSAWVDKSQVAAIVSVDQPQAVVVDNGKGVEVPVGPNIFCDHIGGQSVVTHMLTQESKAISKLWRLETTADGLVVCLVSCDDPEDMLDLEEVLAKKVVTSNKTQELMVIEQMGSKKKSSPLDDLITCHKPGQVQLKVGASSASATINVFVFARPRSYGQRVFFSLCSLYNFMQMTAYGGQPSDWVARGQKTWLGDLEKLIGPGTCIIFGTYLSDRTAQRASLPWSLRCLPEPSISTFACLVMCCRWAWKSKQGGGLGNTTSCQSAELLLSNLLSVFDKRSLQGAVMAIALDQSFDCRSPRPPQPIDHTSVLGLVVTAQGLDFAPVQARAEGTAFCICKCISYIYIYIVYM